MSSDFDETLASSPARGRSGGGNGTGMDKIQPGVVIADRWSIESYLAEGGMGVLYLAKDLQAHERQVVVKFPKRHLCHQEGFLERFDREIASLIAFEHPHVVRVYGAGRFDDLPFVVLQYLPRGSLADWIKKQRLSVADLGWLTRVAAALDSLHRQGIVHRDIKAANILFDKHGEPYLSDFGIVKIFTELRAGDSTQGIVGSPESFAPEFGAQNPYTPAYDQYGLALAVYRALSGRIPYDASTTGALLVQIITEIPPPLCEIAPDVSPALSRVVMKGLSKKPEERYASCGEFARAIEEALRSETAESLRSNHRRAGGTSQWFSRLLATTTGRRTAVYAGAACLVLAVAATAFGLREWQELFAEPASPRAADASLTASTAVDSSNDQVDDNQATNGQTDRPEAERVLSVGTDRVKVRASGRGESIPAAVDHVIQLAMEQVNGSTPEVRTMASRAGAKMAVAGSDFEISSPAFADYIAASTRGAVTNFRVLSVTPAANRVDVAIEANVAKLVWSEVGDRLRIVVAPLRHTGATFLVDRTRIPSSTIEAQLRRQLTDTLAGNRRIAVLDREFSTELDAEIDLVVSGETDRWDSVARLGQRLAADYLLVGRIERFGYERRERALRTSERTLVSFSGGGLLTLRLINVATREIELVQTISVTLPDTAPTTLGTSVDAGRITAELTRDLSEQAARKILGRLVPITVVAIENGEIVLSQGGLTPGQQYAVVLRGAEIKDRQTGKSLGRTETPCCTLRVSRATESFSYARAVEGDLDVAQAFASGTLELRDPLDTARSSTAPVARTPSATPQSAPTPFKPVPEEPQTDW